jgi:hypothetical protein
MTAARPFDVAATYVPLKVGFWDVMQQAFEKICDYYKVFFLCNEGQHGEIHIELCTIMLTNTEPLTGHMGFYFIWSSFTFEPKRSLWDMIIIQITSMEMVQIFKMLFEDLNAVGIWLQKDTRILKCWLWHKTEASEGNFGFYVLDFADCRFHLKESLSFI